MVMFFQGILKIVTGRHKCDDNLPEKTVFYHSQVNFYSEKNGIDAKIFHFHKTMLPFDKNSPKKQLTGHRPVIYFRIPMWNRCKN
jgi:hypothetical protein